MPEPSLFDHPLRVGTDKAIDLNTFPTRERSLFQTDKRQGRELMKQFATEIDNLQTLLYAEGKRRLLIVFQAMDTGGKDGTIRKLFEKTAPQGIRVVSFKRPNSRELAHDYLWRIHPHVPANGQLTVFNRSHYEDIVAVRVRNIYPESRWSKRYEHIVNFETMLADEGTTILKFFLHISREEQKERLQARLDEPDKNWKFNPGDLDDRALWPDFMNAYTEVFSRTSTPQAPWYIIPADVKWQRDLLIADVLVKTLRGLSMEYPPVNYDPASIFITD